MKRVYSILASVLATVLLSGCAVTVTPYISSVGSLPTGESANTSTLGKDVEISTDEPILFRGMDWGIDSEMAKSLLEDEGLEFLTYEYAADIDHLFDDYGNLYTVWGGGHMVSPCGSLTVGGYDVLDCRMYFHYAVNKDGLDRDHDCFYLATYQFDVTDYETVYNALKPKLTELYGNGTESEENKSGTALALTEGGYSGDYTLNVWETTWRGADDTFVTLHCGMSKENVPAVEIGVYMAYGVYSEEEELDSIRYWIEEEAKSEDKERGQSDDKSGL